MIPQAPATAGAGPVIRGAVAVFAAAAFATTPVHAQSVAASLSGVVRDEQRRAVPGATIIVTHIATSASRTTATDGDGEWRLLHLQPAQYRFQAAKPGFETERIDQLRLGVADERRIESVLRVGPVADSITVRAVPVDVTRSTVGRLVLPEEIDRLPVVKRDFASLALLTPGVLPSRSDGTLGGGIAANGETSRNNQFLVDGLALDGAQTGLPRGGLPLDAIQEFAVVTNGAPAEYGGAMGAVVTVVTRSGGNAFAGRASYYHRSDSLDAASGATKLARLDEARMEQHIGGAFLGGPIVGHRLFWFGAIEHLRADTEAPITSPWLAVFRPGVPPRLAQPASQTQALGRVDWWLSRQSLTCRWRWQREAADQQTLEPVTMVAPERTFDSRIGALDASLRHSMSMGSRAVNELQAQSSSQRFELGLESRCPGCPTETRPGVLLGVASTVPQLVDERRWQVTDTLTLQGEAPGGRHLFKVGFDVAWATNDNDFLNNRAGTYSFSSNELFDPARPETHPISFTRSDGPSYVRIRTQALSVFAQDQWQPAGRVTLNLGVRWDGTESPGIADGSGRASPRLGVVVDPVGRGRIVIRASAGRYADAAYVQFVRVGALASRVRSVRITGPTYVPWTPGVAYEPPAGGVLSRDTATLVPRQVPYSDQVSVGFQSALPSGHVASLDVVRARGHRLLVTRDQNYPINVGSSLPARPDRSKGRDMAVESIGRSWYDALLVSLQRRRVGGLAYSLAYTLSRSERTTESHAFVPQDHRFPDAERGPASSDATHQFVGSASVRLPWSLDAALILTARSARPYTITTGVDGNRDSFADTDRPQGVGRNTAREADFWQVDLRLGRTVSLGRARLEVLAEAFNVLNHRNWIAYGGIVGQPTFGRPQSAEMPRQVQLGLRLSF
jgi:hypothetical protein